MGFLKRFFGSGKVRETEEKSQERLHQQTLRDLGMSTQFIPGESETWRRGRAENAEATRLWTRDKPGHCYLCAEEGHNRELELVGNVIINVKRWDKPWSPTQSCFQCAKCNRLTCYTHCDNRRPCKCGATAWVAKTYLQKELDNG
jgi:hypothetical protein